MGQPVNPLHAGERPIGPTVDPIPAKPKVARIVGRDKAGARQPFHQAQYKDDPDPAKPPSADKEIFGKGALAVRAHGEGARGVRADGVATSDAHNRADPLAKRGTTMGKGKPPQTLVFAKAVIQGVEGDVRTRKSVDVDGKGDDSAEKEKAQMLGKLLGQKVRAELARACKSLEKAGGEGSRGGHIVGHSASGTPIYQSAKQSAQAAKVHVDKRAKTQEGHATAAASHERQAAKHRAHGNEAVALAHDVVAGFHLDQAAKAPSRRTPRAKASDVHEVLPELPTVDAHFLGYGSGPKKPPPVPHGRAPKRAPRHVDFHLHASMARKSFVSDANPSTLQEETSMRARNLEEYLAKAAGGKSGEGSHGGHIIGHTKSGKPIYSASGGGHAAMRAAGSSQSPAAAVEHHPQFTAADHDDAAEAHSKAAAHSKPGSVEQRQEGVAATVHRTAGSEVWRQKKIGQTQSGKDIHGDLHPMYAGTKLKTAAEGAKALASKTRGWSSADHHDAATAHADMGNSTPAMAHRVRAHNLEKMGKSMDASDVLKSFLCKADDVDDGWKTPHRKGGLPEHRITEPTDWDDTERETNGGPFGSANAGDAHGAGDSKDGGLQTALGDMAPKKAGARNKGSAQKEGDSKEGSFPNDAPKAPEISDWHQVRPKNKAQLERSMSGSEVAQRRRVAAALAQRGGYDVSMGAAAAAGSRGVPMAKAQVFQRGMVTEVRGGIDERAASLAKGEGMYASRAPQLFRGHGLLTDTVLCKSCETPHPRLYSQCPQCGDGGTFQKAFVAGQPRHDVPAHTTHSSGQFGLAPQPSQDIFVTSIKL